MMEKQYHKLVRDNIPAIIEQDGNTPIVRALDNKEYLDCLHSKLKEEVEEYLQDHNTEELCDILEVLYAIINARELSIEEVEQMRLAKTQKNGAFQNKVFLEKVLIKE